MQIHWRVPFELSGTVMIPKFSPRTFTEKHGEGALPGRALNPQVMSNNDLSGQQAVHPEL